MNTIDTKKAALLKKLKQRLEDSWSGVTQVIEELEEFEQDTQDNLKKSIENNIDISEKEIQFDEKLSDFYLYNLEDLKNDSQDLQYKIFCMINLFKEEFNIEEEV